LVCNSGSDERLWASMFVVYAGGARGAGSRGTFSGGYCEDPLYAYKGQSMNKGAYLGPSNTYWGWWRLRRHDRRRNMRAL
jgi:hypothetical protein